MVEVESKALGLSGKVFPYVVVGIPAFNEENTIAKVVIAAQKVAGEVVVCDDGSSDATAEIADRLGAIVINHEENLGYGAAIRSLWERAIVLRADIFVTIDSDGQHNPEEIPGLIQPIIEGYADVVIGSRFLKANEDREMPSYRKAGIKFITRMVNGSSSKISDAQSGLRAYNKQALGDIHVSEDGMSASLEILIQAKRKEMKVVEVSSVCKYDVGEGIQTSSKNPLSHGVNLVQSLIRMIVEDRPLTLLGIPGVSSLSAGVILGIWLLQIYTLEHRMVTNIALASFSFILIGFFMLSTATTLYAMTRITKKNKGGYRIAT